MMNWVLMACYQWWFWVAVYVVGLIGTMRLMLWFTYRDLVNFATSFEDNPGPVLMTVFWPVGVPIFLVGYWFACYCAELCLAPEKAARDRRLREERQLEEQRAKALQEAGLNLPVTVELDPEEATLRRGRK